ncbi:Tim44/TimA family putative adaptor protein [Mesorhizobium sp. A623]
MTNDLLIVAVIVLYWVLLGNWIGTTPRANDDQAKRKEAPADQRSDSIEDASPSAEPLGVMQEIDSNFNAIAFLAGAQNAYEVILRAYADGETETLKRFVGPDVFDAFERAIAERQGRQEILHLTFIGMSKAGIVSVVKKGRVVEIGVRFVADVITATHSTGGMIIAGNARQIVEVADAWVFAREIRPRNLDWKLVATDGF